MKTMNLVILEGYVASEVTVQEFDNGTRCAQVSMKTRDFHGRGEDKKVEKNFHNLIAWNGLSDNMKEILKKGDVFRIVGHLKTKRIEGKDGAKPVYKTEVVIEEWSKIKDSDGEYNKESAD